MNDYINFISLGIAFCSLVIVTSVFLHCRKIEKKCNYYMAKSIREQDSLVKELERIRVEKEMMEKVLKAESSEAVRATIENKETGERMTDPMTHTLRIDITYFI